MRIHDPEYPNATDEGGGVLVWLLVLNTGRGYCRARIGFSPRPGRNGLGAVPIALFLPLMNRTKRSAPAEAGALAFRTVQAASACVGSSAIASASFGASSCSCMASGVSALKMAGIQPVPTASRSASLAMSAFFNFASRLT